MHDVQWARAGDYFAVVAGFMPAKTTLFSASCKPVFDLGSGPHNLVRWSPQVWAGASAHAACLGALSFAHALLMGLITLHRVINRRSAVVQAVQNALMAVSLCMCIHNVCMHCTAYMHCKRPVLAKSQMCIRGAVQCMAAHATLCL